MTEPQTNFDIRLRRLWKGTLIVAISAGYVLLLTAILIGTDWRAALMALLLLIVSLFLRYIGNDIDRIGWHLARDGPEQAPAPAVRNQRRMFWLLAALTQVPQLALVGYGYRIGEWRWVGIIAAVLVVVEVLYARIRRVNRQVAFAEASYGFREPGLLRGPDAAGGLAEAQERELARRLEALERLAEEGLISRKAYRKACDKLRIRHVLKTGRPLRGP